MSSQSGIVGFGTTNASYNIASTTFYMCWGGDTLVGSTESAVQIKVRGGGTLQNFYVRVPTNAHTASTFRDRKNTANGNLSVAFTASTPGTYSDTTHSTSYVDGDDWCTALTTGSGTGALNISMACAEYVVAGQAFAQLAASYNSDGGVAGGSATVFYAVSGVCAAQATEAPVQCPALESATLDRLQMRCTTYTATNAATGRSRKNAANGNGTVTVNGTGFFEDTTHSDTPVLNDLFNASLTSGATSTSVKLTVCAMRYTGAVNGRTSVYANDNGDTIAAAATLYGGFFSRPLENSTGGSTEANRSSPAPFSGVGQQLTVTVTAYASTSNGALKWRNAGVNGNQNVTVNGTGTLADSTHTDSFVVADLVTNQISGTATGSVTVATVGALINAPVKSDGSAAAVSTAAAVGASLAASPGSASATFAASATGASIVASPGSASATFVAAGVGAALDAGVGASAATTTAQATGASTAASPGSATAVFAAQAVSSVISQAVGNASCSFSAQAVGDFTGGGASVDDWLVRERRRRMD